MVRAAYVAGDAAMGPKTQQQGHRGQEHTSVAALNIKATMESVMVRKGREEARGGPGRQES